MQVEPHTESAIVTASSATPVDVTGTAVALIPRAPCTRDRSVLLPGAMRAAPSNRPPEMWADVDGQAAFRPFTEGPRERSGTVGANAAVSGAIARRTTTPQEEADAILRRVEGDAKSTSPSNISQILIADHC